MSSGQDVGVRVDAIIVTLEREGCMVTSWRPSWRLLFQGKQLATVVIEDGRIHVVTPQKESWISLDCLAMLQAALRRAMESAA
jgi:hypothetical protein